jgi:hypothetical protein
MTPLRLFGKRLAFPAFLALSVVLPLPLLAAEFYVSPSGRSGGNGSAQDPWDLRTAFAQPAAVRPGDTIWLRGGVYPGSYRSVLTGTSGAPIKVRQYPGERATLRGNEPRDVVTLTLDGAHAWYMGFEITNENMRRSFGDGEPSTMGDGLYIQGDNLKVINLVIHDNSQGVGFWSHSSDSEIYGSLIYNNGTIRPDRGHGHGIYTQNQTGTKRIVDNIIFGQFGGGIHMYGSSDAFLRNFHTEGNTVFSNTKSILLGGLTNTPVQNNRVINNYTYRGTAGGAFGYMTTAGNCVSNIISGNYFAGRVAATINEGCKTRWTMSGNTLIGPLDGFDPPDYPSNTYVLPPTTPTGTKIFIRPNQYEPGRANITIYNWNSLANVDVSLAGVLASGARYEVRNAQDFFGPAIASGTYSGGPVRLRMTNLPVAAPQGWPAKEPTAPEFNTFVVLSTGAVPLPPPGTPPPPGPTPTPTPPPGGPVPTPTPPPGGPVPTPTPPPGGPTPTQPPLFPTQPPYLPPPGTTTHAVTVPLAGHVTGVGGVPFVTDVQVENPTDQQVSARLLFFRNGGGSPLEAQLNLSPWQTASFFDVVGNRFGLVNAIGALRLETTGSPAAALRMTSRTYARVGEGTFGQAVSGQAGGETTEPRFVTGLVVSPQYRTNLGVVNTTGATQQFSILLFARSGQRIGEVPAASLLAGEQKQWSIADMFPGASGKGMTAEIRPLPGHTTPLAYAGVVDNLSGDPTYLPALAPSRQLHLPGVARVTGVGLNFFSSDVSISNVAETPVSVRVGFLEREKDNSVGAPEVTLTLGPRETRQMDDVLAELFGANETFGALRIETDSPSGVLASGRIFTTSPTTPGTVGQQVDPIAPSGFLTRGSLLGLRQDHSYRSNVGLYNPDPSSVNVFLALRRADGSPVDAVWVTLPPRGFLQKNLAALFPGTTFRAGEILTLGVDGGGAPFSAFAIVVDNISQDLTFSPGLK